MTISRQYVISTRGRLIDGKNILFRYFWKYLLLFSIYIVWEKCEPIFRFLCWAFRTKYRVERYIVLRTQAFEGDIYISTNCILYLFTVPNKNLIQIPKAKPRPKINPWPIIKALTQLLNLRIIQSLTLKQLFLIAGNHLSSMDIFDPFSNNPTSFCPSTGNFPDNLLEFTKIS